MAPFPRRHGKANAASVLLAVLATSAFAVGVVACGEAAGELQVTNLDPRAGATTGEQPVKIVGNNFRQDISYTVYFGTKRSERATIFDEHTLIVTTPQQQEDGPVDVIVAADNGPAYRITKGFRYQNQGGNVMQQVGEPGKRPTERF